VKFRLSDADRERLGCPDELDVSVDVLPVREAEALEEATGIPYADAMDLFVPRVVRVDDKTLRYSWKPKGVRLLVWLGLYRADITVPFDELTFDYRRFGGWETYTQPEPVGKASGSPDVEPPTPSTSRTSSRRTRSKKSPTST
jgi:hypothetical protein